jgi:hypothetical protein
MRNQARNHLLRTDQITAVKPWGRRCADFWLDGKAGKLYPAEQQLLQYAAVGKPCTLELVRPVAATPANCIRAEFLRFVVLGGDDQNPLHEKGVELAGAVITGSLDLEGTRLPSNVRLLSCVFEGDVVLQDCSAQSVQLPNCTLRGLRGDGLDTKGSLHLVEGFVARDTISLNTAKIGTDLVCTAANLLASEVAMSCGALEVHGGVYLDRGFHACGAVKFNQARVSGHMDCRGGRIDGPKAVLGLDGADIGGSLFLHDGFRMQGPVRLIGAKIAGDMTCRRGVFLCENKSIVAQRCRIGGSVQLDSDFFAAGTVDLSGGDIGGTLSCVGGTFSCSDQALLAPRLRVADNIELGEDCRVAGQISLQGAVIGGDISFTGGAFDRRVNWKKIHETTCINLRNAEIGGTLFWRQIGIARGELNLAGASCLTLNMDRESWEKPSQIRLDNFRYKGFNELEKSTNSAFWLDWINRQPQSHLTTKFRPNPYQQLADVLQSMGHEEEAITIRIERKRRQAVFMRVYEKPQTDSFDRLYRGLTGFWNWVQDVTVGYGYRPGNAVFYLLAISLIGAVVFQVAAVNGIMAPTHPLIYKEAVWDETQGGFGPSKIPLACRENWVHPPTERVDRCARAIPSEFSTFNALVYSIDTAVPVVSFRMQQDWSPRVVDWQSGAHDWAGWSVRFWEWVQIGLGWAFSLLFVSAIGGIIRRD